MSFKLPGKQVQQAATTVAGVTELADATETWAGTPTGTAGPLVVTPQALVTPRLANQVLIGPPSGGPAAPTWRTLVASELTSFQVYNSSGSPIPPGPVRVTGYDPGSGLLSVSPVTATSNRFCDLIVTATIPNNASGIGYETGKLVAYMDTSAAAIGDSVYLSPTSGLTLTPPTAPGWDLQVLGHVASIGNPGDIEFFVRPPSIWGTDALQLLAVTGSRIANTTITGGKLVNQTITALQIANDTITDVQVAAANKDGLPGVYSMRTLGNGAQQAAPGNHPSAPNVGLNQIGYGYAGDLYGDNNLTWVQGTQIMSVNGTIQNSLITSYPNTTLNLQSGISGTALTGDLVAIQGSLPRTATSGILNTLGVYDYFVPPSGSAQYTSLYLRPTIDQTSGANGTTNGIIVSPNIVSASDFRAMVTTEGRFHLVTSLMSGPTNFINMMHSTSTWSGTGINMDFQSGSGFYGGHFIHCNLASVPRFYVDALGVVNTMRVQALVNNYLNLVGTQGANQGISVTIGDAYGRTPTGGINGGLLVQDFFQPTSGTATYSGIQILTTVNQTGGANGITRGLYITPTLTAFSTYRAIETTDGDWLQVNTTSTSTNLFSIQHNTSALAGTAILLNLADSSGSFTGKFLDFKNNTASKFVVDSTGRTGIGAAPAWPLDVTLSATAAGGVAYIGKYVSTLTAAANNDVLSGLYVAPIFSDGVFTGVTHWAARFIGDVYVNGKLTVTGGIDPTYLALSDPANAAYMEWTNGINAANSASGKGRIRYNGTSNVFELSVNGGAYSPISTGASLLAAGLDGYVQFNTGGFLNADSNFIWDNTGKVLSTKTVTSITGNILTLKGALGSASGNSVVVSDTASRTATSGASRGLVLTNTFAPASGTGTWTDLRIDSTINQDFSATGISRGLYINPTVTYATDYRSIETMAGTVRITPNSAVGALSTMLLQDQTPAGSPLTITNITWASGAATVTTSGAHGLYNGQFVAIAGVSPSGYNTAGAFCTVITSNQFSYPVGVNPGLFVSAGTATMLGGVTRLLIQQGVGQSTSARVFEIQNNAGNSTIFSVAGAGLIYNSLVLGAGNTVSYDNSSTVAGAQGVRHSFVTNAGIAATASASYLMQLSTTFNPTSGNATYATLNLNSTINQTGGASGITRGLYITSTITAAADYRAIEYGSGLFLVRQNGSVGVNIGANAQSGVVDIRQIADGTPLIYGRRFTDSGYSGSLVQIDSNDGTVNLFKVAYRTTGQGTQLQIAAAAASNSIVFNTSDGGSVYASMVIKGAGGGHFVATVNGTNRTDSPVWLFQNETIANTLNASSGSQQLMQVTHRVAQTGTASYVGLIVDMVEVTVGSGANLLLDLRQTGTSRFNVASTGVVNVTSQIIAASGLGLVLKGNLGSAAGASVTLGGAQDRTPTSGAAQDALCQNTFAPTSGTATWAGIQISSTINQTGGANGITRGVYINPTLTAAADYRALEVAQGRVVFNNHSTTSSNLLSIVHDTSALTGNVIYSNVAAGSGSFVGDYFKFQNNSVDACYLDYTGLLYGNFNLFNIRSSGRLSLEPAFNNNIAMNPTAGSWQISGGNQNFLLVAIGSMFNTAAPASTHASVRITGTMGDSSLTTQTGTHTALDVQTGFGFGGTWTGATAYSMRITPTINFTGTGGYTIFFVNVTETSVGSGTKRLLDLQVGGSTQFHVNAIRSNPTSNQNHVLMTSSYAPTSGSITHTAINITGTINQTGGANGITRGLYISQTLTAAADYRAIEVANGPVLLFNSYTTSGNLFSITHTTTTLTGACIFVNAAAGSGSVSTGFLMDLQVNSLSKFNVNGAGDVAVTSLIRSMTNQLLLEGNLGSNAGSSVAVRDYSGVQVSLVNSAIGLDVGFSFRPNGLGTNYFTQMYLGGDVNQQGGHTGVTRGLLIDTTLTLAADYRALEITNGPVVLANHYNTSGNLMSLTHTVTSFVGDCFLINAAAGSGTFIGYFMEMQYNSALKWAVNFSGDMTINSIIQANTGNQLILDGNLGSASGSSVVVADYTGRSATSGVSTALDIASYFAPASGTGQFIGLRLSSTIDQTVGGIGTTIGIELLDTLTKATTHYGVMSSMDYSAVAAAGRCFSDLNSFSPTSGTATYTSLFISPTINQTGGANGITRGVYINPTLTAAADYRAIEYGTSLFVVKATGAVAINLGANTIAGNFDLRQIANSNVMFYAQRATDTTPSGYFIHYQANGLYDLFRVENNGGLMCKAIINDFTGTPVTVTQASSNTVNTNFGAGAKVTFNLPLLDAYTVGSVYTFAVRNAVGIRIQANTGQTIRMASSVTALAGYAESFDLGTTVTLVAMSTSEWYATSVVGAWNLV